MQLKVAAGNSGARIALSEPSLLQSFCTVKLSHFPTLNIVEDMLVHNNGALEATRKSTVIHASVVARSLTARELSVLLCSYVNTCIPSSPFRVPDTRVRFGGSRERKVALSRAAAIRFVCLGEDHPISEEARRAVAQV